VDALRYFLLREVPFGQDGSYSAEAIVNRANAELANSFGNLAQRTLSMIFKNLDGVIPAAGEAREDLELFDMVRKATLEEVPEAFERFAFSVGIEAWLRAVFACNAYVDTQAPWALRKTDAARMAAVLGTLVVAVRELARAIAPIIPMSADKLLTVIDAGEGGAPIAQPTPLFPRLELEEETEAAK
jgi:methionyl-tRNA synthetase